MRTRAHPLALGLVVALSTGAPGPGASPDRPAAHEPGAGPVPSPAGSGGARSAAAPVPSAGEGHAGGRRAAAASQEGVPLAERWDLDRPAGRVRLPSVVVEASGLALTSDGARLLVHGDERGIVVVVDPGTGRELGRFSVGRRPVAADLEGIAAVGDRLFLVTSTGLLYEFREAEDGGASPFRLTDTRLGRGCEVEGLDHDPAAGVLLLACKTVAPPGDHVRIHRVPLDPDATPPGPIRLPLAELEAFGLPARLHPSAVAVDPRTGFLLLLAARERLLVEATRDGRLRSVVSLPARRHRQPEGLAVGLDGTLWIADEARGRDGPSLTWYAPRRQP